MKYVLLLLLAFSLNASAAPPLKVHTGLSAPATACAVGAVGDTTAHLTIVAPTTNADGTPLTLPITFSVFMGTSSGGEVADGTGWTGSGSITGLTPGKTYYFYVKAVDTNGASAPSAEVCKSIATAPSPPAAPVLTVS